MLLVAAAAAGAGRNEVLKSLRLGLAGAQPNKVVRPTTTTITEGLPDTEEAYWARFRVIRLLEAYRKRGFAVRIFLKRALLQPSGELVHSENTTELATVLIYNDLAATVKIPGSFEGLF